MTALPSSSPVEQPLVIAIVGAGPAGTSVLERLSANVGEFLGDRRLRVHLIDPYPPGAGRVWRYQQSPLLRMNSMAEDVTMFTDDTVTCEGPIRPGPSLIEWASIVDDADLPTPEVAAEVRALTGMTFPTRRLQAAYLDWVFRRVVAHAPANVTVALHQHRAESIADGPDGRQLVCLSGRSEPLVADAVVFAMGHLDVEPDDTSAAIAAFADRHGLYYLPPAYTADLDLTGIPAGSDVIVRGFGLAFIDLMVLLTEGRGGRFVPDPDGGLCYLASGAEPRLHVGSRRGVPYRAKLNYRLQGAQLRLPRFFHASAIDALPTRNGRPDFHRDVWPLLAKEIGWGYYHELFTAHPDRVAMAWSNFAARYTHLDGDSPELAQLIAAAVPAAEDRLDLAALDRPLRGRRFADAEQLQHHLRAHIEADVARRSDPVYSADLGAFLALLSCFRELFQLRESSKISARSRIEDLDGWWFGLFSYLASGPPGHRLHELLALSRAGIVRFLGADMWVDADEDRGVFRAGSASTDDIIEGTALIEARLPKPDLRRTTDPLLRGMHERGEGTEAVLIDEVDGSRHATGMLAVNGHDLRVLHATGRPHARRFAVGAPTNRRLAGTFSRPRTNAIGFRQTDALARTILRFLTQPSPATEPPDDCGRAPFATAAERSM